jgi:Ca-activated chloride channel family protein
VLLVTDSADSRDAARARELRDKGIITSVLAVGTLDGAPIPSGSGFVSDRAGNVVIAHMDRAGLRSVADAGGGKYTELGPDSIASNLWLAQDGSEFARRDDALGERWKDAGPWLVLLLLPLALAGFRRGLFFIIPLLMLNGLVIPGEASAGWWDDAWQRKDQQAYQALADDDAAKAAALARDPELSGEAWYRSGEYSNSLDAWAKSESAAAHFNQGNALAQLGEYDAALAAYDQALSIEPGMEDAQFNRALVEQMKEQQQQQEQEQGDQGESKDGESSEQQDGEQPEESEGEQGEEGEPGEEEQEGEPSEGEPGDQEGEQQMEPSEAWSEEDAQAMEQWLRRIPDDPGGLLRRKFRNEHQRRGAPDDETESW